MRSIPAIVTALLVTTSGIVAQETDTVAAPEDDTTVTRGSDTVEAQSKPWWVWNKSENFGLDPKVLQPGAYFALAVDSLDDGEIDPLGGTKPIVQLVGFDILGYFNHGLMRVGGNAGIGITTYENAGLLLASLSAFAQFQSAFRIDVGRVWAVSNDPTLDKSQRDRSAFFLGISLPTSLNEGLKDALKMKPGSRPSPQ